MDGTRTERSTRRAVVAWQRLTRSYHMISRFEREALAPFQLTTAQFDVLSHLSRSPGLSQQTLAERLLVTKGNICGLIDRLESAGFVERRAVPSDRRSYQLFLTKTGRQVFERAAPALEERLRQMFSVLKEDELINLSFLFNRLEEHVNLSISTTENQV